MALTLQPIRGFPQYSGETGTRLTTAIHRRLFSQFFSEGGGDVCTQANANYAPETNIFYESQDSLHTKIHRHNFPKVQISHLLLVLRQLSAKSEIFTSQCKI